MDLLCNISRFSAPAEEATLFQFLFPYDFAGIPGDSVARCSSRMQVAVKQRDMIIRFLRDSYCMT